VEYLDLPAARLILKKRASPDGGIFYVHEPPIFVASVCWRVLLLLEEVYLNEMSRSPRERKAECYTEAADKAEVEEAASEDHPSDDDVTLGEVSSRQKNKRAAKRAKPSKKAKKASDAEAKHRFVGRTVFKEFRPDGNFKGTVASFDESDALWKVKYEDGDEEELDFKEMNELLQGKANQDGDATSPTWRKWAILEGPRAAAARLATPGVDAAKDVASDNNAPLAAKRGRPPKKASDAAKRGRPSTKKDSDTAKRAKPSKKASDAEAKHGFVGRTVFKEFPPDGKFKGMVVSFDKIDALWKIKYEDGDEEELDFKEMDEVLLLGSKKKASDAEAKHGLIGRTVFKEFPPGGKFKGTVVSFDETDALWKVKYEDGDEEELDFEELNELLDGEADQDGDVFGPAWRKWAIVEAPRAAAARLAASSGGAAIADDMIAMQTF
jgi:hypothetical protein